VVTRPCQDPRSSDHELDSRSPIFLNRHCSTSPSPSHVSPTPSPPSQPIRQPPPQPTPPLVHPSSQFSHPSPLPLLGCSRCLDPFHLRPVCKS
jgi:hypothetical protein